MLRRGAPIARVKAFPRALVQERIHGFAFGHGIARKFVAEIVEREFEARRKFERVGDGFGQVGEELLHFLRGFQVAFGVAGEQASGGGERAVMANRGEGITQFAGLGGGVADAVGGEQREIERARDVDGGVVAGFFFALEMALQFDVDIFVAEDSDESIDLAVGFFDAALLQGRGQRAFGAAGEADQAVGVLFEFFGADCAFAFFGAQLHFGDQAAEILIAGARGDEEGKAECRTIEGLVIPSGARNLYLLCGFWG